MAAIKTTMSARAATRSAVSRPVPVVRCQPQDRPQDAPPQAPEPQMAPASTSGRSVAPPFALLNTTNERINGRAAMLGFVAAVGTEAVTHQNIVSQLAGRYDNQELVEHAIGASDLTFGMIVALVTLGTLAPRLLENASVDSKSFGPFTPGLEQTLGRAAMMGFAGVLIIEAIKGSSFI